MRPYRKNKDSVNSQTYRKSGKSSGFAGSGMRRRKRRCRRMRLFSKRVNLRRFIPFLICLVTFVVCLFLLADYAVDSVKRKTENEALTQAYKEVFSQTTMEATPVPTIVPSPESTAEIAIPQSFRMLSGNIPQQAQKLYKQNNDLVGWLSVNGLVDLPVVYRDNEYYLTHAFNGEEDNGGTLFLDENHPLEESTQNLVIHGHNMYDSSMFGMLSTYKKLPTVKNHAFARFSTLYAPEEYVIFAVMQINTDVNSLQAFNYIGKPTFKNVADFNRYIDSIRERSQYEIPVDVQPTDSLLTLATCIDDERLVVVYRRIRSDESYESLQAQVDLAYKK